MTDDIGEIPLPRRIRVSGSTETVEVDRLRLRQLVLDSLERHPRRDEIDVSTIYYEISGRPRTLYVQAQRPPTLVGWTPLVDLTD
jgi:hypothetical protein